MTELLRYLPWAAVVGIVGVVCFGWGWLSRHEAQCERERLARLRAAVNQALWAQELEEWAKAEQQFQDESG